MVMITLKVLAVLYHRKIAINIFKIIIIIKVKQYLNKLKDKNHNL